MPARKQWKWGVVFSGENLSLEEILQFSRLLEETKANHRAMIEAFSR